MHYAWIILLKNVYYFLCKYEFPCCKKMRKVKRTWCMEWIITLKSKTDKTNRSQASNLYLCTQAKVLTPNWLTMSYISLPSRIFHLFLTTNYFLETNDLSFINLTWGLPIVQCSFTIRAQLGLCSFFTLPSWKGSIRRGQT